MSWLKIILDMLANLFKWRANATDPTAKAQGDYDEKLEKWQADHDKLTTAEQKAHNRWLAKIRPQERETLDPNDPDLDKLSISDVQALWLAASTAIGHHLTERPNNPNARPGPCDNIAG